MPHHARELWTRMVQPYYVLRPKFALTRLRDARAQDSAMRTVTLPWGAPIAVRPGESVGRGIVSNGVFDLTVSESLFRLASPGEVALDVGANIGQMTSVLAHAVGPQGTVFAFEPHPDVRGDLDANVERWRQLPHLGRIEIRPEALSDENGEAILSTGDVFQINRGSATLERDHFAPDTATEHRVVAVRLDTVLGAGARVGVMKIDVEGHEAGVLRGAEALLSSHSVRDVIYEEQNPLSAPATDVLVEHGYTVFQLGRTFWKPALKPLGTPLSVGYGEDRSLLATLEPGRALERLRRRGWRVLGIPPRRGSTQPRLG